MVKDAPYVVPVRELPVHRTFEVPTATVSDWLKGLPMRDALGAPDPDPEAGVGHAELDLYADGSHAFASGTFKGHLTVACSRCVGPVRIDLDEKLRVTFMPPGEMPSEDEEPAAAAEGAEVREEDLDTFAFDGEKIDLEPVFRERPAIHRFPAAMARRVHDLAVYIRDQYDGDAARVWTDAGDSAELRANLSALPGFGEMKIKALGAVLAKRFDVAAAQDLVPGHPTLGDVDSAQALADYQAAKRVHKAEWAKMKAGAGAG